MNLDQCPRCGTKWSGGDFCGNCGFVPIGAGLRAQKGRKKRKARYKDPGGGRGFMSFILFAGLIAAAWIYKPWADDWALVRYWMGQGHIHSVKGEWNIVKAVALNQGQPTVFANKVGAGSLTFGDKSNVDMKLVKGDSETNVTAVFVVNGRSVYISKMQKKEGDAELPAAIHLDLTWQGPDTVLASVSKDEIIYMQRRKKESGLAHLLHYGLRPGKDVAVPNQMQGIIKGLDKQLKEEEQ